MGDKVKPRHTRAPGQGGSRRENPLGSSKVLRDMITDGPAAGPHKDKRGQRKGNPIKAEWDAFWENEWDGKSK